MIDVRNQNLNVVLTRPPRLSEPSTDPLPSASWIQNTAGVTVFWVDDANGKDQVDGANKLGGLVKTTFKF